MKHLSSFEKKSNFSRHFKGWKFIRLCILCYIFVFLHQLFLSLPLWSICFDKFYKKNCICEVGIYFIFRNPYIALSIKVSRRRRKEILSEWGKIWSYLNWTLLDFPFYTAWFKAPLPHLSYGGEGVFTMFLNHTVYFLLLF